MPVPALRRRDDSLAYLSSSYSSSMLSLSSCNHHDHDYFQYILILMTRKMVRIDHGNLNLIFVSKNLDREGWCGLSRLSAN